MEQLRAQNDLLRSQMQELVSWQPSMSESEGNEQLDDHDVAAQLRHRLQAALRAKNDLENMLAQDSMQRVAKSAIRQVCSVNAKNRRR